MFNAGTLADSQFHMFQQVTWQQHTNRYLNCARTPHAGKNVSPWTHKNILFPLVAEKCDYKMHYKHAYRRFSTWPVCDLFPCCLGLITPWWPFLNVWFILINLHLTITWQVRLNVVYLSVRTLWATSVSFVFFVSNKGCLAKTCERDIGRVRLRKFVFFLILETILESAMHAWILVNWTEVINQSSIITYFYHRLIFMHDPWRSRYKK